MAFKSSYPHNKTRPANGGGGGIAASDKRDAKRAANKYRRAQAKKAT